MKIPRYSSTIENPVGGSNRSLTTGTHASNTLAQIGASAVNKVLEYGSRQNTLTAKLRRLEINTNINNGKVFVDNDTSIFIDDLKNKDEFIASPTWAIEEFKKKKTALEEKYKKSMDDQTWKEFKPFFWENVFNADKTIRKTVNDQLINNAVISLDRSVSLYHNKIEKATSVNEMKSLYESHTKLTLPSFNKLLITNDSYLKAVSDTKQWTNQKIAYFQASENVMTNDPDGRTVPDHKSILANLKNPNYKILDIDGKEITPDDDVRKNLIKTEQTAHTNQDSVWTNIRTEKNRASNIKFNDELTAISRGNVESSSSFLYRLELDTTLEPNTKKALRSSFFSILKELKTGTATWDGPAGIQAKSVLTYLVNMGIIDTNSEFNVINSAQLEQLLKPEDATALLKLAKDNVKNKNSYKNKLTKNAIYTIGKELNVDMSFIDAAKGTDTTDPQAFMAMLMSGMNRADNPLEAYEAMNNFHQLLAVGFAKGHTIEDMLLNPNSGNYIVTDIIATHKARIDEGTENKWMEGLTVKERLAIPALTNKGDGSDYLIKPDIYWEGKTSSSTTIELPTRNTEESITAYIERIGNIQGTKDNKYLPQWVTNDYNIDSVDVTGILIKE